MLSYTLKDIHLSQSRITDIIKVLLHGVKVI